MAVRGTKREMRTIPLALRSAAALNPGEIIVGIDGDHPEGLPSFITENSPAPVSICTVDRDPSWGSPLAKVVYEMYKTATHDAILCFDCDSELTPEVLDPLHLLGKDGVAAITFLMKLKAEGFVDWWRYRTYRKAALNAPKPYAGIYWIWRPFYMDLVRPEGFKKMHNSIDTYLIERLKESKYDYMSVKSIGCIAHDVQTFDYPWHQYMMGIWMAASARKRYRNRRIVRASGPFRNIVVPLLGFRAALARTIRMWHPWALRGYFWAMLHPHHSAVELASDLDRNVWLMENLDVVNGLRRWSESDRGRTGFPQGN